MDSDDGIVSATASLVSSRADYARSRQPETGITDSCRRLGHMVRTGGAEARRGRQRKVAMGAVVAVVTTLALLCVALLFSSGGGMAASWPKGVSGHVYDSGDEIVVGATVVVEIWDGATLRYTQPSVTTDSEGFYTVTIGTSSWDTGDTIKVTATDGVFSGSSSTAATPDPAQTIDVHLTEEIPEFSGMFLVVVSLVTMFAVMRIGRKRRRSRERN